MNQIILLVKILRINHKHIHIFLFQGRQRRKPLDGQRRRPYNPLIYWLFQNLNIYIYYRFFIYIVDEYVQFFIFCKKEPFEQTNNRVCIYIGVSKWFLFLVNFLYLQKSCHFISPIQGLFIYNPFKVTIFILMPSMQEIHYFLLLLLIIYQA